MQKYNFDTPIDRTGTHTLKYDKADLYFGKKGLFPMWIADMDLATPDFIFEAIKQRLEHPILGYTDIPETYFESVINWQKKLHGWEIKASWIENASNVLTAIGLVIQSLSDKGDAVLIQEPVYYPFRMLIERNERQCVSADLTNDTNRLEIDFDTFEEQIQRHKPKLFILCHPHNPSGRVWSKPELEQMATICLKHKVIIISDEIHSDLTYSPLKHIPIASLSDEVAMNTITVRSPSKMFNLAGACVAGAIIPNPKLHKPFAAQKEKLFLDHACVFNFLASNVAYSQGEEWRREVMTYLKANEKHLRTFLAENLPTVQVPPLEASFLPWLDFRQTGLSHKELLHKIYDIAKIGLSDGVAFGKNAKGFFRMNIAVPRSTLTTVLETIKGAFTGI